MQCAAEEMKRLREQERGALFEKLFAAAKKKHDDKKHKHLRMRDGEALMDAEERERCHQKYSRRRAACGRANIFGRVTGSWEDLLSALGNRGDPWIYIPQNPAEADELFGGQPLRKYCTNNLRNFVLRLAKPGLRMLLVPSAGDMPPHLQLAAALTTARVQEHVLRPLLQYRLRRPVTLAFTKAFCDKHPETVVVAFTAADRLVSDFWPAVNVLRLRRFWAEVEKVPKNSLKQLCLIYEDDTDDELHGLTERQVSVARSWTEFVHAHIEMRGVALVRAGLCV